MLDRLIACAGAWRGTNTLQDPEMGIQPETTDSIATVTPLLEGRFVRIDYTWSYRGTPQFGSMLIGHQKNAGTTTVHWIDSWHNSDRVMALDGGADGGVIDVRGSYAVPPGPDWGWRVRLDPAPDAIGIRMHNVSPDGQAELAVDARYRRG